MPVIYTHANPNTPKPLPVPPPAPVAPIIVAEVAPPPAPDSLAMSIPLAHPEPGAAAEPLTIDLSEADANTLKAAISNILDGNGPLVIEPEEVPQPETGVSSAHKSLIDLVGKLQDEIAEIEKEHPQFKKLVEANKKLKTEAQIMAPLNIGMVVMGNTHRITLKPAATKRSVKSLSGIRAILGEKAFMELASVALSDIDKYLTPEQQNEVLNYDLADTRTYKVDRIP